MWIERERVGDSKVSCVWLFVTQRCSEDGVRMVEQVMIKEGWNNV